MHAVVTGVDEMSQQDKGVLVAIDWESIRRGARLYQRTVTPAELCRAMREVGGIFGQAAGGKAFGDWKLLPDDGREFTDAGMALYHAPRTGGGKDRTDPAILLEVYGWIRDREDCGTVILGSGDADYQALVDRAKSYGKRIVVCAFSQSVSRDMLATAPLFPLEAELGIQTAVHGDVRLDLAAAPERDHVDGDDVESDEVMGRFVRQMYDLESRMNFVGYSMLVNQWMLDWGIAWNEYECRRLVDEYQQAGILDRHEVTNRSNPDWPTSAVRLVRSDGRVRRALGFSDGPVSNPALAKPALADDAAPVQGGSTG